MTASDADKCTIRWGVRIPLRDGVHLTGILYLPSEAKGGPTPAIVTMTPYTAQNMHPRGPYFAARGFAFLSVDVRGRGNSEGEYVPYEHARRDGHDVIEWVAAQSFCDGNVSMYGGSYGGYIQWMTAAEKPAHLKSILPIASPFIGVDMPMRRNISFTYILTWHFYVAGRALQSSMFADMGVWTKLARDRFESGEPFETLGEEIGFRPRGLLDWIAHPMLGEYYEALNPSDADYAALDVPVLTITGAYDSDQFGALEHYRKHQTHGSAEARARHFLVIGPWDHIGTMIPSAKVGGVTFGPASVIDTPGLLTEWYRWTLAGGPKPSFLKDRVAYYVAVADDWRYAPDLDAVTAREERLLLSSKGEANAVTQSGTLGGEAAPEGFDAYLYDPRDLSSAEIEPVENILTDQRRLWMQAGKYLAYHSAPFAEDRDIAGFFRLDAWISIDQPDTDLSVAIYEVLSDGSSVYLADDQIRARHRESPRREALIRTQEPLLYRFDRFNFIARRIVRGSRLRLVVAPLNDIGIQKNYNAEKPVSSQSMADARTVTVRLHHDAANPSALFVPIAAESAQFGS